MATRHVGKLPPRYSFLLNPYSDVRLSKCPRCQMLTHERKFALFVHVEGWGPLLLGKTCRCCTPCELIIVHQDELEAELAQKFATLAPQAIGNDYLVVGTVDKKVWQDGMQGQGKPLSDILAHLADFKEHLGLKVEPGGWVPADRA